MSRTPHWEVCDDEDCPVCEYRRDRLEAKAEAHLRARKLRLALEEDRDGSATLEEFV